jgi:hypothetical protein
MAIYTVIYSTFLVSRQGQEQYTVICPKIRWHGGYRYSESYCIISYSNIRGSNENCTTHVEIVPYMEKYPLHFFGQSVHCTLYKCTYSMFLLPGFQFTFVQLTSM